MANWSMPPLPPRLSDTAGTPFVGRSREMERLDEIWDAVLRGERQAVFVAGEPGSGKTRLASESAIALHAQGAAVLLGTLSADLAYPYRPFVEALDAVLTSSEPGGLADLLPDSAAELARVAPAITRHRPDLDSQNGPSSKYRKELFDAFVHTFEALASERPIALILEDLHWASPPTRLLLAHLIESTDSARLLLIATLRNTAPDRSDDMSHLIADLYRLAGVHRFDLLSLDSGDIEDFLRAAGTPANQAKGAAALLRDHTGGNPFFLTEIWRDLGTSGGVASLKTGSFRPPASISDAVSRRMDSFGPGTRQVVGYAAVLGEEFAPDVVARAAGLQTHAVLDALDQAVESGIVESGPGAASFSFVHSLVRQTIFANLSPSDSAIIHYKLAETLEESFDHQAQLAQDLARLYKGAGALGYQTESVRYLQLAAEEAERSLAYEEAAELWQQAAGSGSNRAQADRALLRSADNYLKAAEFSVARGIYSSLASSRDEEIATLAAIGYEDASWRVGKPGTKSRTILERAIGRIDPDPGNPLYVRSQSALGRAYAWSGQSKKGAEIGRRAIEMAQALGDDELLCEALHASMRMITPQERPKTHALAVELAELAASTGNFEAMAQAGAFIVMTSYMAGDANRWLDGIDALRASIERTGSKYWTWVDNCIQCNRHFMRGEFDKAMDKARTALDMGYQFGDDDTEGPFGIQMFMIKRETSSFADVLPLLTGNPDEDGSWVPGLLAIYTEVGFTDPARELLRTLLEMEPGIQGEAVWPAVLAFMAEAAIALRDEELLKRCWPLVAQFEGQNLMAGASTCVFGSADRYLAQIEGLLGDTDSADRHFRSAIAMDSGMGSLVHQAESIARYSQFLERHGQSGRAADFRSRALSIARPIGHRRVIEMLDESGYSDLPDGLTPREVDVLRLLAAGSTNREIGTELYISQNTAANHVRNILMKTRASNRTQAAIYAADRGLLD